MELCKILTYGLDFDNTFTADPELTADIIRLIQKRGHDVIIVTARRNEMENRQIVKDALKCQGVDVLVYFTGLGSKLDYMAKRGVHVDVWMDDDPRTLVHGH